MIYICCFRPIITVHFLALNINRAIMHQHITILLILVQMFWYIIILFYFSIIQMTIGHHVLLFYKGNIFLKRGLEDWSTLLCQILLKLVHPLRIYCDFWIIKMAASAILHFQNHKILLADAWIREPTSITVPNRQKRSIHCRDIAFLRWRPFVE